MKKDVAIDDIKIEHPIYPAKRISRPNRLITDQIRPFNPATMIQLDSVSYCDKTYNNIVYRKDFRNKHKVCYNERYFVVTTFMPKTKNDKNPYIMVKLQFIPTYTVLVVTYKDYCKGEFYDPYFKFMYNGTCCIGNIDYSYYREEWDCWDVIMARSFDPSHDEYILYGGDGLVPSCYAWTCFETFHKYNEHQKMYGKVPVYDPNDAYLYQYYDESPLTADRKRLINGFPMANDYNFTKTKRYLKDLPLNERDYSLTQNRGKVGRPAGSTNKPKEKKLMYRVIKPNADLKYDQSLIV